MSNRRPLQYPRFQAWNDDETFLEGGTVTFYEAGSTTKRAIYQDADLTVQAPNPVTLNSRGEPEANDGTPIDIYVDGNPYKIVLKDADGGTVHTIDDYVYDGSNAQVQFVALDLGNDGNDESSGLNRISIANDTNGIATETVADELLFDMSQNWPVADDVPDSAIDHDQTTNFVANEHIDHTSVTITAGTGLSGGGDISSSRSLSVDEANVDHDSLQNFVANEHIDHSSVTITAGTGLSGGGDITTTRTLNLDINPLTTVTLSGSDEVAIGDVSDANNIKKVTAQDIADLGAATATALPQDPENATDGGTDAYASETTTGTPAAGIVRSRDFQSANTTTTPTLDGITLVDKDGNALWAGAINGLHLIKYDGTNYRVTNPIGTDANVNNAPVARDSNGRAKFSDPSAAQDAVTKSWHESNQQVAQAWVNFNGTGTVSVRDHYNVSSITDNGTGDYTVNFSNNLADASYSTVGAITLNTTTNSSNAIMNSGANKTISGFDCSSRDSGTGSNIDVGVVQVAVFGGN